jgi:uncharacterized membrane protein YkvA (DUF1232 family)
MDEITDERYRDFYQRLRERIRSRMGNDGKKGRFSEYLMAAPDLFHLLVKLLRDEKVPLEYKAWLGFVIAYFISPIDLIPESIVGPVGYLDDIALAAFVLNRLINRIDPGIVEGHWAGDGDVIDLIRKIVTLADQMIGSGMVRRLKDLMETKIGKKED